MPFLDHGSSRNDHIARDIGEILSREAAQNARGKIGHNLTGIDNRPHHDAVCRTAIANGDDRILRHVDETTGKITGVCCLQRGVRETFTGTVGRVEVFKHVQTFFEV